MIKFSCRIVSFNVLKYSPRAENFRGMPTSTRDLHTHEQSLLMIPYSPSGGSTNLLHTLINLSFRNIS